VDLSGNHFVVDSKSSNKKTVLLVFSSQCPYCDEAWPVWRDWVGRIDSSRVHIVGVNLGPKIDPEYLKGWGIERIPVLASVDPQSVLDYRLRFTPQTIGLGVEGRVERVLTGPPRDKTGDEFGSWIVSTSP